MRKVAYIYLTSESSTMQHANDGHVSFVVAEDFEEEWRDLTPRVLHARREDAFAYARLNNFTHARGTGVPWDGIAPIPHKPRKELFFRSGTGLKTLHRG